MKIFAHTIVRNEENFLWFSVLGVIDHVDKLLLWDTGSTDGTLKIVDELKKSFPEKIDFREVGEVDAKNFSKARQEMLDKSECDWVLVLDGDEIWWKDSVESLVSTIKEDQCDAIVVPFINFVGDTFHYLDVSTGRYKIDGRIGNVSIKAFRKKIPGLSVSKDYGSEGYIDETGAFIQESKQIRRIFLDSPFIHATHLTRSSKDALTMGRRGKVKAELGNRFPLDFYYPESFFKKRPGFIKSPWGVMNGEFKFKAFFATPLRKLKRNIFK